MYAMSVTSGAPPAELVVTTRLRPVSLNPHGGAGATQYGRPVDGSFDNGNAWTAPTSVGFGVTGPEGATNKASGGTRVVTLTACIFRSSFPLKTHRSESTRPAGSMHR